MDPVMAPPSLKLIRGVSEQPPEAAMPDSGRVAKLRAQVAQNEWHTEKLRLLGLQDSYLESYFLGEALQSQLDEALKRPDDPSRTGD
jgi:hypothetical protein